jgi:hypothetical protein
MSKPKRTDVPETITDEQWEQVQRGAAKQLPAFPVPWDPRSAKVTRLNQVRDNAASN